MTLPEATVVLDCIVTVPSFRPAPVIAVVAAAWLLPTTLGTLTVVVVQLTATVVTAAEAVPDPAVTVQFWLVGCVSTVTA